MRQALHIFRKDAHALRLEIGLFIALAGVFAWSGIINAMFPFEALTFLLDGAGMFLIARAVHAEPLVGDRQFWLTRPYSRASLAAAKLLFIACFVCAPIGAAQILMLIEGHFPLAQSLPGLMWSQLLLFAASLTAAALAAMLPNTLVFVLAIFTLGALGVTGEIDPQLLTPDHSSWPAALAWLQQYAAIGAVALTAGVVLLEQYRKRTTVRSAIAGVAGLVAALLVFLSLPVTAAFFTESLLSPDSPGVTVSIDARRVGRGITLFHGRHPDYRRVRVALPVVVRGLAANAEARLDALSVSFEWPGLPIWKPDLPPGTNPRVNESGVSIVDATVLMEPAFYALRRDLPVTISGAVYLTIFGRPETRTVALGGQRVNLQDGIQCSVTGEANQLVCRSFFRWPDRLVSARSGSKEFDFQNSLISYSPFPADAGLSTMQFRLPGELSTSELTFTTKRPLSHFWQAFATGVYRLSDFEGPIPLGGSGVPR